METRPFWLDEPAPAVATPALDRVDVAVVGAGITGCDTPPRVTHRWAGIFGLTQDLLPLVGRVPGRGGVWVSAGYSGHGNVLGLMCGELVAAGILGVDDPLLELFAPSRLLQLDPS